jgi:hypothetical protein
MLVFEIAQALRHQARPNQKHNREGHLRDEQRLLGRRNSITAGAACSAEGACGIAPRRHPGRRNPEHDSCPERYKQSEAKYGEGRTGLYRNVLSPAKRKQQNSVGSRIRYVESSQPARYRQ